MSEDALRFTRDYPALSKLYPIHVADLFSKDDRFSPLPMINSIKASVDAADFVDVHGNRLRLEFFISLRKELNAYAALHDDRHFIGITHKKVLYSFVVCQEAFFLQLVFKELKDDVGEVEAARRELDILYRLREAQTIDSLVDAFEQHIEKGSIASLWKLFDPVDHVRRTAAWYTAQTILDLSLLHEMSHVLRGHCGYLAAKLAYDPARLACLNEVDMSLAGLDDDDHRWLEHEADFYAASYLTHDVLSGADARRLGITGLDTRTRIALITFAVCLLCAIWSKDHRAEPGTGRYPHPLTRALTYLHGIELALLNHGEPLVKQGFTEGLTNVFVLGNYIPQIRRLGELAQMGAHWMERDAYQKAESSIDRLLKQYAFRPAAAGTWPPQHGA